MSTAPEFRDLTCLLCGGEGATLTPAGIIDCSCTWGMRCPRCETASRLTIVEQNERPVSAQIECDPCGWTIRAPYPQRGPSE